MAKDKQEVVNELDTLLAQELLMRVKSGVATAAELREARAYLGENKHLIEFQPEGHHTRELHAALPDLTSLPDVIQAH